MLSSKKVSISESHAGRRGGGRGRYLVKVEDRTRRRGSRSPVIRARALTRVRKSSKFVRELRRAFIDSGQLGLSEPDRGA